MAVSASSKENSGTRIFPPDYGFEKYSIAQTDARSDLVDPHLPNG